MSDDKWEVYSAAEEAVEAARDELNDVADNLTAIAGALRKNPLRLTLPNPNFSETLRGQNDEPSEIDLSRLPDKTELHKMAIHFVECEKASIEAYAALPENLRNRITPKRR